MVYFNKKYGITKIFLEWVVKLNHKISQLMMYLDPHTTNDLIYHDNLPRIFIKIYLRIITSTILIKCLIKQIKIE